MKRALRLFAWVGVLAYMALIFYLSAQQDPLPTVTRTISDKVLHGCEYGGLAVAWLFALRSSGVRPGRAALIAFLAAVAYGATDEFHQRFVAGRNSEIADWVADSVGAACVGLGYLLLKRYVIRGVAPRPASRDRNLRGNAG